MNLPDLDILIALSAFYEVDIRELIAGERASEHLEANKPENPPMIEPDTAHDAKVPPLLILSTVTAGVLALACFLFLISLFRIHAPNSSFFPYLIVGSFMMYCIAMQLRNHGKRGHAYFFVLISGFTSVVISSLIVFLLFFGAGGYHNYGIAGIYYGLAVVFSVFLIAGAAMRRIINKATTSN